MRLVDQKTHPRLPRTPGASVVPYSFRLDRSLRVARGFGGLTPDDRVVAIEHERTEGPGGGSRVYSKDWRSKSLRRYVALRRAFRQVSHAVALAAILGLVVWSAILTKEAKTAPVLAAIHTESTEPFLFNPESIGASIQPVSYQEVDPLDQAQEAEEVATEQTPSAPEAVAPQPEPTPKFSERLLADPSVRFFNGRPVRPARKMWMTVTGYSPDARSCPGTDDGLTSTLHSVTTNAHRLVAADPRVLPYGSMLTVDGYDAGQIVPVLDCGGKIKGRRLDLLFPTHEQARQWGKKKVLVTVWEYADGKPAGNPRKGRAGERA